MFVVNPSIGVSVKVSGFVLYCDSRRREKTKNVQSRLIVEGREEEPLFSPKTTLSERVGRRAGHGYEDTDDDD